MSGSGGSGVDDLKALLECSVGNMDFRGFTSSFPLPLDTGAIPVFFAFSPTTVTSGFSPSADLLLTPLKYNQSWSSLTLVILDIHISSFLNESQFVSHSLPVPPHLPVGAQFIFSSNNSAQNETNLVIRSELSEDTELEYQESIEIIVSKLEE
jgi:hypothetical protein